MFVSLAGRGLLAGDVLDAGCGTGEHALLAAECGARPLGVDLSPVAIERARTKAQQRHLTARFEVGDILTAPLLTQRFDVVIDSGLFHVFSDADRARYVGVLAGVLRPGGRLLLACFSDHQPGDWGPRRVRRDELYNAFADGWSVETVEPIDFEIKPTFGLTATKGWLATVHH